MTDFYTEITQFEPLIPAETAGLEDLALELTQRSASLTKELPPSTLEGVIELLRIVNSYYSNLIEGNNTHPIDVERAMRRDYSTEPAKRDRQIESLIHIDVQTKISRRIKDDPNISVTSADFLLSVHGEFYSQMPQSLRWVTGEDGMKEWVEGGKFRATPVSVGKHLPPDHRSIDAFLRRFDEFYNAARWHGTKKMVAIAASHHRLMWIHPFLDGNGRVARLFTDAFFLRSGIAGYGLWNASRGLARRNRDYRRHLDAADFPRENDLDGRGNLSDRTLTEFCRFFLEVCIDQAEYMSTVLALGELLPRIAAYIAKRAEGTIVSETGEKATPLNPRVAAILSEAAIYGELPRSRIVEIIGMSERSARSVTRSLIEEGLLVPTTTWHRSPLRLGFPPHAAGYWFPNLFPDTG